MKNKFNLLKKVNYRLSDYFSVIRQGIKQIGRDNINLLASGMVYSTLIAIVPCITFLSAFLSAFGALEPFLSVLSEWMRDTFGDATGSSVMSAVVKFTGSAMSLGVVGLVSFIITGMFLVNKIYSLVNHIFRTEPTEGTMKRFVLILIFLIVFTVVLTFAFALGNTIHDKAYTLMGIDVKNGNMREYLRPFAQIAVVFFVFFFLICFVPNAKINASASISGAALGTVLAYISTFIFTRVISYAVSYSVIYGSLASILFVLLYLYIIWYLVVFVMEVTYIYQFRPDKNAVIGRPERGDSQIAHGIDIMLEIARRFENGEGSTSIKDLGAKLAIPMSRINSIISDLEGAGLIISMNVNSSVYMLSRPSSKIKVVDVIDAVFSSDTLRSKKMGSDGEKFSLSFFKKGIEGEKRTLLDLVKESEK